MKKILGLDIGTNSIGFAIIETTDDHKLNNIVKLGARIVVEDPDFHGNFNEGRTASKNADRRVQRGIRRLNQRYKLRRDKLVSILKDLNMFPDEQILLSISSIELYGLRSKALEEQVTLQELGRIFYHLNQRRGFKSNRKSQSAEENETAFMERMHCLEKAVADTTIGRYLYGLLIENPTAKIRENVFPRKEYEKEFDLIWESQKRYYPNVLTGSKGDPRNARTAYNRIKNQTIFYQRRLKSQKALVNFCTFEKNMKVTPKSSPLFQWYRIWQQLNNLEITNDKNEVFVPTEADKLRLFGILNDPSRMNLKAQLSSDKILKELGFPRGFYLNYPALEGNKTVSILHRAMAKAGVPDPAKYLFFDPFKGFEQGGLFKLWHITYSIEEHEDLVNALAKHFPFSAEQAAIIADNAGYTSDYGSLSAKAIRKLVPYLAAGKKYHEACTEAGYKHWEPDAVEKSDFLSHLKPNELRNPVVEQVLNQMTNVVNLVIDTYGRPDEIRVELARELKNNSEKREEITRQNAKNRKRNEEITSLLMEHSEFRNTRVSNLDIVRYKLWEDADRRCLYSGKVISLTDLYNGSTEIEHIIPKSRFYDDSLNNKIISYRAENQQKDQETAFDYMKSKGEAALAYYLETVNRLKQEKKISKTKYDRLTCKGEEIPQDFISRQIKETQYISKQAISALKKVCDRVVATSGSVTATLRKEWDLEELIAEINLPKYQAAGKVKYIEIKDSKGNMKKVPRIEDWSKRDDHRHHALDALVIALTHQGIIQQLNTLNADYSRWRDARIKARYFEMPDEHLREKARQALDQLLVSFKKPKSKVLTPKINKLKTGKTQNTWVPRGSLHEDTMMGEICRYEKTPLKKALEAPEAISDKELKTLAEKFLSENHGDVNKAFKAMQHWAEQREHELPAQITVLKPVFSKRVKLGPNLTPAQVQKIIDTRIRKLVEDRIKAAGGKIKEAFKDYEKNPIYQNLEKGIVVKSVRVTDDGNLQAVRETVSSDGEIKLKDFVYLKGNHHALIYKDDQGNFSERVVTFWEAVEIGMQNLRERGTIYPIIDRSDKPGLKFQFSIQINDLFLIDVNPDEIDILDPENRSALAPNLFRVQKISSGDYNFRHQYETTLESKLDFAFKRIRSAKYLGELIKVSVNQLGEIIKTGE